MALGVGLGGIAHRLPPAAVPQHHRAAAILALGNDALERAVLDRMVLDMDSEALGIGIEARPFRHRPALEHAVELEAEIVVHAPRRMRLDDIAEPLVLAGTALRAGRLGRPGEVALAAILAQTHGQARSLSPHAVLRAECVKEASAGGKPAGA